ncbi:hypothetical protein N7461_000824 [Penicillium sp. DV-2018c]|nr:hypothetical protein N7461_000824 [Penicillium sp. DV-2018c]
MGVELRPNERSVNQQQHPLSEGARRRVFFPSPPVVDLFDNTGSNTLPVDQILFPPVSQQEVRDTIKRAPPDKVPGDDNKLNRVWKMLANNSHEFVAILTAIMDTCTQTGYNPPFYHGNASQGRSTGVSATEIVQASWPVEHVTILVSSSPRVSRGLSRNIHNLLPKTRLGRMKGVSVDNAIKLILGRVHRAWGTGGKVSMLLLDVAGAYDNVSHQRLFNKIKRLRLGQFAPQIA